ncbi:hypothetical protein EDB19DRAFT_1913904 [Suillus lakei]|nr:hypothetical protein EDB19DRAFT_1913904 [Suillus lakei]
MIIVWHQKYEILRDSDVILITRYPTVLTLISTVISTILSVTTTALFSSTVNKAIVHYTTRPMSLIELHTAIALTKPQPLVRWDHHRLSFFTLIIVGLIMLLNSSWTTLLLQIPLLWPVSIKGKDLDFGSSAFDAKLGLDTTLPGLYANAYNMLDIMAPMSGTSAARLAVTGGGGSVFAFNVSHSPGAIDPGYYGGKVAINTSVVNEEHRGRSGLARNYTVTQQGLSANITCSYLDTNEFSLQFDNTTSPAFGSVTATWEWIAHCPLGIVSGCRLLCDGGLLAILVCPTPGFMNATSFDILLQGMEQYHFLDARVYKPRDIQPLQNNSMNVTAFISNVVQELSISSQMTYNNPLGELLQLNTLDRSSSVNEILENYFRSVVEFSATYLRSAYSAHGANSTIRDLGRLTYIYIIAIFTVIWAVTVSAAAYSLIQERTHPHTGPVFDASNPVHLMMASSAGGLETLAGFENDGVVMNERARVRFLDGRGVVAQ